MARGISKEGLTQRIEKIEKAISKNREQYDKLTEQLEPGFEPVLRVFKFEAFYNVIFEKTFPKQLNKTWIFEI